MHSHNWQVTANVCSDELNNIGIVMDFGRIDKLISEAISPLRGSLLQKNSCFSNNTPTAEMIAKYIFEQLESKLPKDVRLESVEVTEQPGCSAKFSRDCKVH